MNIIATFDSTLAAAPAGYQAAVAAAILYVEKALVSTITVNLTFNYSGTGVASSAAFQGNYDYAQVVAALRTMATGNADLANATLPDVNPFAGTTLALTTAQSRQLGLSTDVTPSDATVTLSPTQTWNMNPSVASVPGAQNGVTTLVHEITEALGRQAGSDNAFQPSPLAFYRYTAPNTIDTLNTVAGGYLSLNNGVTNLVSMGNVGGDVADFNVAGDAFGSGAPGDADTVTRIDLLSVEASGYNLTNGVKFGGGSTVTMAAGNNNAAVFHDSGASWDTANGTAGTVLLTNDQASVVGGGNAVTFYAGLGTTVNAASLYATNDNWDAVNGSFGAISLVGAQASITGGANWVYLSGATNNAASLYATGGLWDNVIGSSGAITLNSAQANVTGGSEWIYFDGAASNAVSLYQTGGFYDNVSGSNGAVTLVGSQANVTGGGNRIFLDGSTLDAVSLYSTNGVWDSVTGSNGAVTLNSAQANVTGGRNYIYLNGTGTSVSLYGTGANPDIVAGSNATLILNSASASLAGGGDTVFFNGTGNALTISGAGSAADALWGSNATIKFISSQATLAGTNNTLQFDAGFGLDRVGGFDLSDVLRFSSANWADYAAFQTSGAMTQAGADTLIRLDAQNAVTLTNVTASTLGAGNFSFA